MYSVNSLSLFNAGAISLIANLNYEEHQVENFRVSATFADGVISRTTVQIIVLDVNDECPSFTTEETVVTLTEPLNVGLVVAQLTVVDNDTDAVNTHSYSVMTDYLNFAVNQKGLVYVDKLFESATNLTSFKTNMTVSLTDFNSCGVVTHMITVIINKILIQEYAFNKPMYIFPLNEDTLPGHLLHCFKLIHSGTFSMINNGTSSSCFSLSSSGLFFLFCVCGISLQSGHGVRRTPLYNGNYSLERKGLILGQTLTRKSLLERFHCRFSINLNFYQRP